jgi:hypothetical protein
MGGGSKRSASTYSLAHMPYTTGKKIGEEDGSNSTMHSGFPLPYIDMRWGMKWIFPKRENQWTGGQEWSIKKVEALSVSCNVTSV